MSLTIQQFNSVDRCIGAAGFSSPKSSQVTSQSLQPNVRFGGSGTQFACLLICCAALFTNIADRLNRFNQATAAKLQGYSLLQSVDAMTNDHSLQQVRVQGFDNSATEKDFKEFRNNILAITSQFTQQQIENDPDAFKDALVRGFVNHKTNAIYPGIERFLTPVTEIFLSNPGN